jgi:serine/threonine protein kinase
MRLFDMGRWKPGRREFVFVVMEYAEQTLDQILGRRALSLDEVREMLPPTLDALAYLHRNQLVHGQLRPSNFLAVNDQLKLASDNVRPAGQSTEGGLRISLYNPPELNGSGASAAGDVWGFGMTLLHALTLGTPEWQDQRSETASLPANLPAPFVGLVRRCLSRSPANRPTVIELEAPFKTAVRAHSTAESQPLARPAPREVASPPKQPRKRNLSLLSVTAALVLAVAGWVHFSDTSQAHSQASVAAAPAPVVAEVIPAAPEPSAPLAAATIEPAVEPEAPPSGVLQEVKPNVPPDLSEKIRDPIDVTLRVLVDPAGDVMAALTEGPGRNKSLARLADDAAREWKFVETEQQTPRVWLLRFEFTREGVITTAAEQ